MGEREGFNIRVPDVAGGRGVGLRFRCCCSRMVVSIVYRMISVSAFVGQANLV